MLFRHSLKTLLIIAALCATSAHNLASALDFIDAKRILPSIYKELNAPATIYCNCPLNITRNRFSTILKACGYQVRKQPRRAARIEHEHVMPAWQFGHQLKCWQQGGRSYCQENSSYFNQMEGDLHNIYPAIGEVNGDRSNFRFTQWNGKPYQYGSCPMLIDFKHRTAQPPTYARGKIARSYLYMAKRYGIKLSPAQNKLLRAWNEQYRPDADECLRNRLITTVQGNDNPFITAKCR